MDKQLYSNNATTTLADALNSGVTTVALASGGGALFNSPVAGEFELVTIYNSSNGDIEICKVTARTTDTLTVVRQQEGTTSPATFPIGATVEGRVTAASVQTLARVDNTGNADGTNLSRS